MRCEAQGESHLDGDKDQGTGYVGVLRDSAPVVSPKTAGQASVVAYGK